METAAKPSSLFQSLGEEARITWVSKKAKEYWKPILDNLAESLSRIESRRDSFIQTINLTALPTRTRQLTASGYYTIVLEMNNNRVKLLATRAAKVFIDDISLGRMLNYSECCIKAFYNIWTVQKKRDFFIDQKSNSAFPELNLIHRHMGIRLIFHQPCSYNCEASKLDALQTLSQLTSDEQKLINDILRWPYLYTTLHGLSEIQTPIYKVVFAGDYYATKHRIDQTGTVYPKYGARGLSFPFNYTDKRWKAEDTWTINGFANKEAMDKAHEVIISLVENGDTLVDLGCGSGLLMRKIKDKTGHHCIGYDSSNKGPNIHTSNIINWNEHVSIAVISHKRLLEQEVIWDLLYNHAKEIILYSYDTPINFLQLKIDWKKWEINGQRQNDSTEAFRLKRLEPS